VIGDTEVTLIKQDPLIITGMIDKEGDEENIVLIHYLASITDESAIGDAQWFSLEEVMILDAENKTSSENVRIASSHFLTR
jgi:uncharacterized membrane protein affecting hemolysin expression